jgi:hypothetical protein
MERDGLVGMVSHRNSHWGGALAHSQKLHTQMMKENKLVLFHVISVVFRFRSRFYNNYRYTELDDKGEPKPTH